MARIKIDDLPADQKISREEMKKATGGLLIKPSYAYYLDRDSGTVLFGDGLDGMRLPTGTINVAATYRSGSGSAGNVT